MCALTCVFYLDVKSWGPGPGPKWTDIFWSEKIHKIKNYVTWMTSKHGPGRGQYCSDFDDFGADRKPFILAVQRRPNRQNPSNIDPVHGHVLIYPRFFCTYLGSGPGPGPNAGPGPGPVFGSFFSGLYIQAIFIITAPQATNFDLHFFIFSLKYFFNKRFLFFGQ